MQIKELQDVHDKELQITNSTCINEIGQEIVTIGKEIKVVERRKRMSFQPQLWIKHALTHTHTRASPNKVSRTTSFFWMNIGGRIYRALLSY